MNGKEKHYINKSLVQGLIHEGVIEVGHFDAEGNFVRASPDSSHVDFDQNYNWMTIPLDRNGVPDSYNFKGSDILPRGVSTLSSILDYFRTGHVELEEMKNFKVRAINWQRGRD